MPRRLPYLAVMGVGLCLACPGCDKEKLQASLAKLKLTKDEKPAPEEAKVPPEVAGTVAEFAGLVGGGSMLVDGHGMELVLPPVEQLGAVG